MRHKLPLFVFLALLLLVAVMVSSGVDSRAVAGRTAPPANLAGVPVLNYHKVENLSNALSLSPQEFDRQMAYLYANGYHTITPDQLMDYFQKGGSLPDNPILITFDDGYLDNYTNAYFIMKKYGFTAAIFLVTDLVGQDPRFMNWDQVREMQQAGFVFGSHTVSHRPLPGLEAEEALAELVESSRTMKRELGVSPRYLAYPTGAYNRQVGELAAKAGYRAAFTIKYGLASPESNYFAIERIPIFKSASSFKSFYCRLNGAPLVERLGLIKN